jgi:hypothetical protein
MMKILFRIGFVLLPLLFFMSTNAYPSDYSLVERNINAVPGSRSIASTTVSARSGDANQGIRLNALSPQVPKEAAQNTSSMTETKDFSPAMPIEGKGVGVQVAIFSFK